MRHRSQRQDDNERIVGPMALVTEQNARNDTWMAVKGTNRLQSGAGADAGHWPSDPL